MSKLDIQIEEDRANFAPGEELQGQVEWRLDETPESLQLHLLWLKHATRRLKGLIVTSHLPGMLPTLIQTTTSPQLLEQILRELVGDDAAALREEVPSLFERHHGNVREILRNLYDRCAGD